MDKIHIQMANFKRMQSLPTDDDKWFRSQKSSRTNQLYKQTKRHEQDQLIKDMLVDVLLNKFAWDYWVTFTFGYKPYLEEVEDVLYELHKRIDRRILKHSPNKSIMFADERSEWFLIPELQDRGLHYHGFIKLNINPNIISYEDEWSWMVSAFKQNLDKFNSWITTLEKGRSLSKGFRIYQRSRRRIDDLKEILYSLKEYSTLDGFDRFLYTIISHIDWKPTQISQHRTPNKIPDRSDRPNKIQEGSLQSIFGVI